MKKYKYHLLFAIILIVAAFLRFYNLSGVPNGLQQDETSIGYNAYSILKTGHDEYGKLMPATFKAFGEYKLPLSIYLTTGSFAVFGVSEFSLRFPSALFGLLTVGLVYFLTYRMFQKKEIALTAMFLLAINPWHIHFSRGAYEVTPALFFITLGVLLFVVYTNKNSITALTGSFVAFAISMYGYNIARLFVPLFLVFLITVFHKKIFKEKNKLFVPLILFIVLLLPFLTTAFTKGGYGSTKGTLIPTSAVIQASNLETRSYITDGNPLAAKLVFNQIASNAVSYGKNISSYVNGDFLFGNGSAHGNHGIGNVGQFYIWEIITIILGSVILMRTKNKFALLLFGWIAGVVIIASATREAPHATRAFFLTVPLVTLSALGLVEIIKKVAGLPKKYSYPLFAGGIIIAVYFFSYYLLSYYYKFPVQYAKQFRSEDKKLAQALKDLSPSYDEIYIDNNADILYTSLAFYALFPPVEFQKSVHRAKDDSEGFSKVVSFGKFEYIDPANINPNGRVLLVSDKEKDGYHVVQKFSYPQRPVVVAKGQDIVSFPVTETAYVLLEKN